MHVCSTHGQPQHIQHAENAKLQGSNMFNTAENALKHRASYRVGSKTHGQIRARHQQQQHTTTTTYYDYTNNRTTRTKRHQRHHDRPPRSPPPMAATAPTLSLQPFPSVPFPLPVGWVPGRLVAARPSNIKPQETPRPLCLHFALRVLEEDHARARAP